MSMRMMVCSADHAPEWQAMYQSRVESLQAALAARDEALVLVEENADDFDRQIIDQAIRDWAAFRLPFSMNDIRDLLPGVRSALIGSRFRAAALAGIIRSLGWIPSTDPGSHGRPIREWTGVEDAVAT